MQIQRAHAIIDIIDKGVKIAGEIIKRSQSVTHRLLSANMEKDQSCNVACSQMTHDNSLSLSNTHLHSVYE